MKNLNKDIKSFIFLSSLTRFGGSLFNRVRLWDQTTKKPPQKCGGVVRFLAVIDFRQLEPLF